MELGTLNKVFIEKQKMLLREFYDEYTNRGWECVPVYFKGKGAFIDDWYNIEFKFEDFIDEKGLPRNIGLKLGKRSNWLVDVDLDHPIAVKVADCILCGKLATGAVFGHQSNPNSHRLYYCEEATTYKEWKIIIEGEDGKKKRKKILEYRSTGHQTVAPPSIHESGEPIEWDEDNIGIVQEVSEPDLLRALNKIASICVLVPHWHKDSRYRHDATLALAGWLARRGWTEEETLQFVQALCVGADDEDEREKHDRTRAVKDTYAKFGQDKHLTGYPTLAEYIPEEALKLVSEWLFGKYDADEWDVSKRPIVLKGALELMNEEIEPVRFLIPNLLPEIGMTMLAGNPKIGKSLVALQIALGLGMEGKRKVLGIEIECEPIRTLYLSLEDHKARTQERIRKMHEHRFEITNNVVIAWEFDELNKPGMEKLERLIQERKFQLVIIDPIGVIKPEAKKNSQVYDSEVKFFYALKSVAIRNRMALLLLYHTRKPTVFTNWDNPLAEILGSQAIAATIDTGWIMFRVNKEGLQARWEVWGRDMERQSLGLVMDDVIWTIKGDWNECALSIHLSQIYDIIRARGSEGITRKEIYEEMKAMNSDVSQDVVSVYVWRLKKSGMIYEEDRKLKVQKYPSSID